MGEGSPALALVVVLQNGVLLGVLLLRRRVHRLDSAARQAELLERLTDLAEQDAAARRHDPGSSHAS